MHDPVGLVSRMHARLELDGQPLGLKAQCSNLLLIVKSILLIP